MADDLKETLENLSPLIGKLAVTFALAEQWLDECVLHIHSTFPESRKCWPEIPRALGKKLDFLKECFKTIATLADHKDDGFLIIRQMKDLSDDRNFLIHGAPTIKGHGSHHLKLRKICYQPTSHRYEDRTYTWRKIRDLVHKSDVVAVNVLCVTHSLKMKSTKRSAKAK
jgi:hypothetical protein